jgi:hypothetical protein
MAVGQGKRTHCSEGSLRLLGAGFVGPYPSRLPAGNLIARKVLQK